jgi:transcriptional regulator with XRE-family HTH domain
LLVVRTSGKLDSEGVLSGLGRSIRAARRAQGRSQEELADLAGLDRSHMGKIERGERNITLLNLVKVAEALSSKPSEVLREAGF